MSKIYCFEKRTTFDMGLEDYLHFFSKIIIIIIIIIIISFTETVI